MTIPRLVAFTTHWESHPPLAVTVAAIAAALGFEFKSTKYADPINWSVSSRAFPVSPWR
jgi:hypothetical protein